MPREPRNSQSFSAYVEGIPQSPPSPPPANGTIAARRVPADPNTSLGRPRVVSNGAAFTAFIEADQLAWLRQFGRDRNVPMARVMRRAVALLIALESGDSEQLAGVLSADL